MKRESLRSLRQIKNLSRLSALIYRLGLAGSFLPDKNKLNCSIN